MDSNVAVSQAITGQPNTLGNFFDTGLIHKIIKSKLVGILEFKLIVVCQ